MRKSVPTEECRSSGKSRPAQKSFHLMNRQRKVRADWPDIDKFLGRAAAMLAPIPFSVAIVSDAAIRTYNRDYRKQDKATDVLSFPTGEWRVDSTEAYLGDIVISAEMARRNAAVYGLSLEDE